MDKQVTTDKIITHDQGQEFISHELIQEEYGIKAKPSSSGNPIPNEILEIIQLILGNLAQT